MVMSLSHREAILLTTESSFSVASGVIERGLAAEQLTLIGNTTEIADYPFFSAAKLRAMWPKDK
jgi:hypothetical protein